MTTKQEIAVYTDGSLLDDPIPALGAGWVAVAGDQVIRSGYQPLRELESLTSPNPTKLKWRRVEASEVLAATMALNILPPSYIRLHTDARAIRRFFTDADFRAQATRQKLKHYYTGLSEAFSRHTILSVEMRDDELDPLMRQAHLNAQHGAFIHRYERTATPEKPPIEWPPKLPPDAFDM